MTATLRNTFAAALKSLLRGKSFLQALLTHWVNPATIKKAGDDPAASEPAARASPTSSPPPPSTSSTFSSPPPPSSFSQSSSPSASPLSPASSISQLKPQVNAYVVDRSGGRSTTYPQAIEKFLAEAEELLLRPVQGDRLRCFASQLKHQFHDRLLNNAACMLPSYNHQLPCGHECGRYLSLDVGGSTLRVAVVELRGRHHPQTKAADTQLPLEIVHMQTYKITPDIKLLKGMLFFNWMAARIVDTLSQVPAHAGDMATNHKDSPLAVGLAWSFPIEQTSLRGGLLQGMGKGFLAADTLLGQDLGDIIQRACLAHGLHVELAAIVNDSAAALLSKAYSHSATRFSLILGTGVNIAVHLPVPSVGRDKFGSRPQAWFEEASHVIINTELGMFGHGILPMTRWDQLLKAGHPKPEFQPLEHMVSGYYLGEVCRFALIEAVETAGLFGGVLPPSLREPYALDTQTISMMESDDSASLATATEVFCTNHPFADAQKQPTRADIAAVRQLASLISQRSAALMAASVHALWALKAEAEQSCIEKPQLAERMRVAAADELRIVCEDSTVVAFNGSVIERYPHYREMCQAIINDLVAATPAAAKASTATIELVPAEESSLLGAAVALACLK